MAFPEPVPGLVIRYSYLWRVEQQRGRDEGIKDRPCAVVLVTTDREDRRIVTVLPVTHTMPVDPAVAIEIPSATKARLRLDDEHSWVVLSEANRFLWPGPDLRPRQRGDASSVVHGLLPYGFFETVRIRFVARLKERRANVIGRSE